MNEQYYNFKEGKKDAVTGKSKPKGIPNLLTLEQIGAYKSDPNKDYYMSIYKYTKKHKDIIDSAKSAAGISDVVTDTLVFDFDSKNLDEAKNATLELGHRLVDKYNVDPDNIHCFFSAGKGFHVIVPIDRDITVDQFKKAVNDIGGDIPTFDLGVFDYARVLRVENTKHQESGLYKIPLHLSEIEEMSISDIKELAKVPRFDYKQESVAVKLPEALFKVEAKKKSDKIVSKSKIPSVDDYKNPPKPWKQYKWSLVQGFFEASERHQALMVIAATARSMGYDQETTYFLCKSALKKQARRTNTEEFSKEELYNDIIQDSVFSDRWSGGAYSPDNNAWLKSYCVRMGFDTKEEKKDAPSIKLDKLIDQFIDFSTNFETNLIKTGIKELDENLILSTSTLNGLLGQPGSGKSTIAIEILKNASLANIPSMFFSLDMSSPIVFSKLVQKESGLGFKSSLEIYREQKTRRNEISTLIKTKYKNVGFNFRCGLTVADMKKAIEEQEEQTGIRPKFIVVDYLENIAGPYSDPTANAGMITNQLKDMATELEVCILLLLQTQKHSTPDISDALMSMKQIKGSSSIEQNCSVVVTLWREGYSPDNVQDDKYISFALVKNRFGPLWKGDFSWNGIRGDVNSLSEEQRDELADFKRRKRESKLEEIKNRGEWS